MNEQLNDSQVLAKDSSSLEDINNNAPWSEYSQWLSTNGWPGRRSETIAPAQYIPPFPAESTGRPHINDTTIVPVYSDKDEIEIREKAIEAACKSFGYREVELEEFGNALDYFYNYLKFGTKLAFDTK